jgi:hypothetical protein
MPRLPVQPPPPDQVFALATPAHMLMKLWWEIEQLRKSLSVQSDDTAHLHAPAYHAFNCAVTAWHLADWVWQSTDADGRAWILSKLVIAPSEKGQTGFSTFTRTLMKRYRVLHLCRQLATGSKHKIVESYPDPDVAAREDWDVDRLRVGSAVGVPLVTYSGRLSIRDREVSRPALEVFEEAARTWHRLLSDWGFVEGRFVDGQSAK